MQVLDADLARRQKSRERAAKLAKRRVHIGTTCAFGDQASGQRVILTGRDFSRHVLLTGATGVGKTNLLLVFISWALQAGFTIVVLDLRGDLYAEVLAHVASVLGVEAANRLHLFDFADDDRIVGLNPLQGRGDVHARALFVLNVLSSQAEGWGVRIDEVARHSLVGCVEAGCSLVDIERLLTSEADRNEILERVSDSYVRSFFERYSAMSPEQQMNWYMPVLNKINPLLATPRLRACLSSDRPLDVGEILDRPAGEILLFNLAASRFHKAANLMGGLIVSSIQDAVMARARIPEEKRQPVMLFVDEFQNFASDAFANLIAEGRRYKCALTLAHQNGGQVGTDLRDVLLSNVHLQFSFQTGARDASEISREVTSSIRKDEIRDLLVRLRRGHALMIRRGDNTELVRVRRAPQSGATADVIAELRERATRAYAKGAVREKRETEARAGHSIEEVLRHEQLPHLN